MPRTTASGPSPQNLTDTMAGEGDCTIPPLQFTSSASPTNDFLWRLRYLKTFGDSAYPPPMPTDVQINMTPSDAAITWSSLEEHVVSTQRRWKRFDTPSLRANTPSYAGSRLGAGSPTTYQSTPHLPQQPPIAPQPGSTCKVALHQKQLDEADQGGDASYAGSPVSRGVAGLPPMMSRNVSNVGGGGRGNLASQRASIGGGAGGDRRLSVRFALPGDNSKTPVLPSRKGLLPSNDVTVAPSSSASASDEDIAELGEVLEGFVAFPTDAFVDNDDLASNWGGLNSDDGDGGGGLFKPPLLVIPNSEELLLPSQQHVVVPYSPLSVSSPTLHNSNGMGAAMLGQALTDEASYFMPRFYDGALQEMSYAVAALRAAAWPLLMDGSIAFNHCVGEHSAVSVAGRFETADVAQTAEEYGGSTFLSSLMYLHHKRQATISEREQQSWDANYIEERNRVTLREENARLKRFAQKEMKALPKCMQFTQSHLDVIRRLVAASGGASSAFKKAAAAFEAKNRAKQSKSNKQVTDRLVSPGVVPKGLSAATPSLGGAAHAALVLASSPSSTTTNGGVVPNPLQQEPTLKFFAHTKTHPVPPSKQVRPTEATELDQGPYGVWPIEADDVLAAQRATANPSSNGLDTSSNNMGRSFRLSDQASIAMRPFMACISNPATLVSQGGSRETAYNLFPPHFSFAMDWHEAFRRRRHWELSPFLFFLVRDESFNYSHIAALLETVVSKCAHAAHTHSVPGEDLQGLAWSPPGSHYKVSSGEAFATEVVHTYCNALKRGAYGGLGQQQDDQGATEEGASATLGPRATRCHESAKMAYEVASRASVGTCLCGALFTPTWDNVDELGAPIPGVSQLKLHDDGTSTKGHRGKKRKQKTATHNHATQSANKHSAAGLALSPLPTTSELLASPPLMATFLKRVASGRVEGSPAPSAPTHHHNSTAPSPLLMTTTSPVCPMGLLQKSMDDVVAVYEHTSNGKTLELLAWLLRYFTVKQLYPRPPPSANSTTTTTGELYEAHKRFTEVEYNYLFLLSDFMDTQWDGRGRTLPTRAVDNVGGAFSLAQTVEKRLIRLRAAQQLRGDALGSAKGVAPGAGIPEALQRSLLVSPWPVLPQVPTASLFSTPLMLLCSYARPYVVNWLRPIVLQLGTYFESYHLSSTYAMEEMAAEREDADNSDPTLAGESPISQRTRSTGRKTGRTPTTKTSTSTPGRSRIQANNSSNSILEDTEDLRQQRIRRRCRVQMYTSTEDVKSSIDRIATKVSSLEESVDNIYRLRAAQNIGSNQVSPRLTSANVPTIATTTTNSTTIPRYVRDLLLEREHHIAECVEDGLSMVSRLLIEHADTFPPGVRYLISKFTAMISVHLLSTLVPPLVLRDCLSAVSQNDTTELVDRLIAAISPAGDGTTSQYESPIVTDAKGGRLAKLVLYDLLILPILRDPVGAGILAPGDAATNTTTAKSNLNDDEKWSQSMKSQPSTRPGSPTFYTTAASSRSGINDESQNSGEEGVRPAAIDKRSITSDHARHNFTALATYLQIAITGPFAARRDHFSDQLRRKGEPTVEEGAEPQDPRVTKFINDCYDKEVGACFAGLPQFNKLTPVLAGLYNVSTGHLSKYTPIQTNLPPPRRTSLQSNASLATPAALRSNVHSVMSTRRLSSVANTPIQLAVDLGGGGVSDTDNQDGGLLEFGDPSSAPLPSTSTYAVPSGTSLDHLLTERTKRHLQLFHLLPSSGAQRSGAVSRQPSSMAPRPPTTTATVVTTSISHDHQTPTTTAPKTPRKPAPKGSAAATTQWGDGISNLIKGTVNTVESSSPATYSLSPLMARLNERLGLLADGEGIVRNLTASHVHRHFLSRVGPGYQRRLFVIGGQGTSSVAAAYRFHEGMFQRKMGGGGGGGIDTGYDGRGSVEPWSFLWDGGMPMDADAADLLDTFAFYSSTDHSTTTETSALWEHWKAETGFECSTSLPPSVISGRMVSPGVSTRGNAFSSSQIQAANQQVMPLPAFPLELACHPHRRLLVPPKALRHLHKQATAGVRLEAWRLPSQDFIVNCTSSLFKVATSSHEALLPNNDNRVPLSFGPMTSSTDLLRMAARLGQFAADALCGKPHNSTSSPTSGVDDFSKATVSSVVAKQWKGSDVEEGGDMVERLLRGLLIRYGIVGGGASASSVSTMQDTSAFTQAILQTLAHPLFVGTALDNIHINNPSLYDALLLHTIPQDDVIVTPPPPIATTSNIGATTNSATTNPIAHMIDALPPLDEVGFLLQCLRDFCSSPFGMSDDDTGRTHGIDSNGAVSVAAAIGGGDGGGVTKPYLPSSLCTKQRWFVDSALLAHRYKMTLNEKSGGAAGRMPIGLGSNYGGDSDPSTPSISSPLGAMMRLTDLGQEDDDENTRIRMEKFAAEALTELTAHDPLRAPPPRGVISLSAPSFAPPPLLPSTGSSGDIPTAAVPSRGRFGRGAAPRTVGVQPIPQPSTSLPVDGGGEGGTHQGAPLVDRWWSYMMLAQVGKVNRLLVECGVSRGEGSFIGGHTKMWEDACEAQVKRVTRSTTTIKPTFDRVGARIQSRRKEVVPVEDTAPLHRAVGFVAQSEAVKKGAQRLEGARGMPHDGPLATATAVSLRGITALGIELDTPPIPHPPARSKHPTK